MHPTAVFFAHTSFSLMILCGILLMFSYFRMADYRKNQSVILTSLLMLCGAGYSLSGSFGSLAYLSFGWWIEYNSSNALPGLFWLVCVSTFSDRNELKTWQYCLASSTFVIPLVSFIIQVIFSFDLKDFPDIWGLVNYGALTLELTLICHVFVVAIKNWPADLVQTRRFMRASVLLCTAIYIVLVIVVEQLFNVQWIWLEVVKFALLTSLAGTLNLVLFTIKGDSLFDSPKERPTQEQAKTKVAKDLSPELQRIIYCMKNEKFYQNEGVTITALSKHLAIHEYKLRQLINGELAYRNFNDFLNFYRIQEVAQKLATPANNHLPVLTLALDSGFRSLSSFNKAFKTTHGHTPTEYRNKTQVNGV